MTAPLPAPLEAAASLLVLLNIALVARRSMWSWPLGIAAVACWFFVFAGARLWASAGLQLVFLALNLWGWRAWARAKGDAPELPLTRWTPRDLAACALLFAPLLAGIWALTRDASAAPASDAAVAAAALLAQWQQGRRAVESWALWAAINVGSVGLYASQGLWLAAGTYAALLAVALWGWRDWRRAWRAQRA